jgi:hypothetical protein|tara:strand:+ start:593 stop:715 length:123 start_codon:yes stop_codon:yes gene_type:complete
MVALIGDSRKLWFQTFIEKTQKNCARLWGAAYFRGELGGS